MGFPVHADGVPFRTPLLFRIGTGGGVGGPLVPALQPELPPAMRRGTALATYITATDSVSLREYPKRVDVHRNNPGSVVRNMDVISDWFTVLNTVADGGVTGSWVGFGFRRRFTAGGTTFINSGESARKLAELVAAEQSIPWAAAISRALP